MKAEAVTNEIIGSPVLISFVRKWELRKPYETDRTNLRYKNLFANLSQVFHKSYLSQNFRNCSCWITICLRLTLIIEKLLVIGHLHSCIVAFAAESHLLWDNQPSFSLPASPWWCDCLWCTEEPFVVVSWPFMMIGGLKKIKVWRCYSLWINQ